MDKILFVNHSSKQCGVYQYGATLASILKKSKVFDFIYIECDSISQLKASIDFYSPVAILFNYHPATLPWVREFSKENLPTLSLIHEVDTASIHLVVPNSVFDHFMALDPTITETDYVSSSPCMIREFGAPATSLNYGYPVIGSFGFGFANKGFKKIVDQVQSEYDSALIRLHIPFAAFGDAQGHQALDRANECRNAIHKSGIKLEVTHDFRSPEEIFTFLKQNDINIFLYDEMYGRGLSSTAEFSLAARKPLMVTRTTMFRHLLNASPTIFYGETTIQNVINNGTIPLEPFYKAWSQESLINKYETTLSKLISKR